MATMVEVLNQKEDTLRKETEAVMHRAKKTKRKQDKQVWARKKAAVLESKPNPSPIPCVVRLV